jgi:transposase
MERQAAAVDTLKAEVLGLAQMRRLAMRFRDLLSSRDTVTLTAGLKDAHCHGIYAMRRFARTLRGDADAVRNAVAKPWSNGPTEGSITRHRDLKTMRRYVRRAKLVTDSAVKLLDL